MHKDYRIFLQKVIVDLNLNLISLGTCETLYSEINGGQMSPCLFKFLSDSICIMIYDAGNQGYPLALWERNSLDSTSSFFDSFQDKEVVKWKLANQYYFSHNVTSIRRRELSIWIGLENGKVFELQVKPWNIQERDLQSYPFLDSTYFMKDSNNSVFDSLSVDGSSMDSDDLRSVGPVRFLMESPNELLVLSVHQESRRWKFSINHFLGIMDTQGSFK